MREIRGLNLFKEDVKIKYLDKNSYKLIAKKMSLFCACSNCGSCLLNYLAATIVIAIDTITAADAIIIV
jgi:hypothetical protein